MGSKSMNIVLTEVGKKGETITIILDGADQAQALAHQMFENEELRNIILESINKYADNYINPMEFVRFLSQNKN